MIESGFSEQASSSEAHSHCPACGTEYLAGPDTCADCGTELVLGSTPEITFAIPYSDDLVLLVQTQQARALELEADLKAGEIPHHLRPKNLDATPPPPGFLTNLVPDWSIYVRADDLWRAQPYVDVDDAPLAMTQEEIDATIGANAIDIMTPVGYMMRWVGLLGLGIALLLLLVSVAVPDSDLVQSGRWLIYASIAGGGGLLSGAVGMMLRPPRAEEPHIEGV